MRRIHGAMIVALFLLCYPVGAVVGVGRVIVRLVWAFSDDMREWIIENIENKEKE